MSKTATLMLILIIATTSLITVKSALAQTQPSVPEFTLKVFDYSYDVPTTSSIDAYTGKLVTQQGYHVQKMDLVMAIKNQPLVYQFNSEQSIYAPPRFERFYYNINLKGHYTKDWNEFYIHDELPSANASSSETLLTIGHLTGSGLTLDSGSSEIAIAMGGQEDFQVEALIGYIAKNLTEGPLGSLYFVGETSGWSPTQTLTISNIASILESPFPTSTLKPILTPSSPTPSPSPSPSSSPALTLAPSPTQQPTLEPTMKPSSSPMGPYSPTDPYIILIPVLIAVVAVIAALVYVKKNKRNSDTP
jgi:hypothetical protein